MSYDLSRLYIKINDCPPGKRLIDNFSELSAFKEFTECDDTRIKIAILSGDVDSPFVRIKDRDTMMRAIFDELGLDIKRPENKELLDGCASYCDDKFLFAWTKYIEILHETDFTDWQLAKKDYQFFLEKANTSQNENESDTVYMKRRKEAREQVKTLGKEVKEIEAKIFPDSKAAREALIAEAKKKIGLYAEKYAQPYAPY